MISFNMIRMKEYRLQRIEIEEIACGREILALVLHGLFYFDYDFLKNATTYSIYYRRNDCYINDTANVRGRVKYPGVIATRSFARLRTRSDRDEKIDRAGYTRSSLRESSASKSYKQSSTRSFSSGGLGSLTLRIGKPKCCTSMLDSVVPRLA